MGVGWRCDGPAHSKAFWLFVRIAKKFCSWFKRVSAKRSTVRRRRTLRAVSYWTSETLGKRAPRLISPFNGKRIQQGSYELGLGEEAFVSGSAKKTSIPAGGEIVIPIGQIAVLLTEEIVQVPADAIAFISIKSEKKLRGLINVSGFHVDPGFTGKLIFSVFNAGVQEIHLNRGVPLFMIWYAALDQVTADLYHGAAQNQMQIPDSVITNIAAKFPSPQALKEEIDVMKRELHTLRDTTWALILLALTTVFGTFLSGVLKPTTATQPQVVVNTAVPTSPAFPSPIANSPSGNPSTSVMPSESPQSSSTAALSPTSTPTTTVQPSPR